VPIPFHPGTPAPPARRVARDACPRRRRHHRRRVAAPRPGRAHEAVRPRPSPVRGRSPPGSRPRGPARSDGARALRRSGRVRRSGRRHRPGGHAPLRRMAGDAPAARDDRGAARLGGRSGRRPRQRGTVTRPSRPPPRRPPRGQALRLRQPARLPQHPRDDATTTPRPSPTPAPNHATGRPDDAKPTGARPRSGETGRADCGSRGCAELEARACAELEPRACAELEPRASCPLRAVAGVAGARAGAGRSRCRASTPPVGRSRARGGSRYFDAMTTLVVGFGRGLLVPTRD
jgi:hypothetical protein